VTLGLLTVSSAENVILQTAPMGQVVNTTVLLAILVNGVFNSHNSI